MVVNNIVSKMSFVIVIETSSVLGEKDQLETLHCNLRAMYSAFIQETGYIDEMYTDSILVNREFNKTTTAIATGTSLNKRFNKQDNGCARAQCLYISLLSSAKQREMT